MNFAKKTIAVSFVILFLLTPLLFSTNEKNIAESTVSVSKGSVAGNSIEIIPNHSGQFFVFSSGDDSSVIACYDGKTATYFENELSLDFKYSSAYVCGNKIYVVENANDDDKPHINLKTYNFSNGTFSLERSLKLNNFRCENKYSLAADENNNVYCINEISRTQIVCISDSDINNFSPNSGDILSISTDFSGSKLYVLTSTEFLVCSTSDGNFNFSELTVKPDDHCTFLNDQLMVSTSNIIYGINGTEIQELYSVQNDTGENYVTPCLFGNYIISQTDRQTALCYDIDTKTATHKIEFGADILSIAQSDNITIAILDGETEKSIKVISNSDLINLSIPEIPNENYDETDPAQPSEKFNLSSPLYTFDKDNHIITGVPASTTIAVFKDNINNPNNLSMTFTNYLEKSVTSGKLGTNSTVYFTDNFGESVYFKFIILGDVTGEGNINSRDKTYMYNHLFSKSNLDGIYLKAADINQDGVVDTLDLLLMDKYT